VEIEGWRQSYPHAPAMKKTPGLSCKAGVVESRRFGRGGFVHAVGLQDHVAQALLR
jgi:hypothetical protein